MATMSSPIDTMEAYMRGAALDMLEMMKEVGVDSATVSATAMNGLDSVYICAYKRGRVIFHLDAKVTADGELVSYE